MTLDGASGSLFASQAITNTNSDRQVWMSNNGTLHFGTDNARSGPVTINSPDAYNDGSWHFVVATQGSDGMHLYVDGTQVASNPASTPQGYLGYWRVGGTSLTGWSPAPTSDFFGGSISDVSFYNSELSASQVSDQYTASPAATPSSAPSSP